MPDREFRIEVDGAASRLGHRLRWHACSTLVGGLRARRRLEHQRSVWRLPRAESAVAGFAWCGSSSLYGGREEGARPAARPRSHMAGGTRRRAPPRCEAMRRRPLDGWTDCVAGHRPGCEGRCAGALRVPAPSSWQAGSASRRALAGDGAKTLFCSGTRDSFAPSMSWSSRRRRCRAPGFMRSRAPITDSPFRRSSGRTREDVWAEAGRCDAALAAVGV